MPKEVERIARRHLRDPKQISVDARTASAETVRQRYWIVSGLHKLDALTRILEVEPIEAALIFVRTRIATTELAERLDARGYAAAALNGEMQQKQREQMIDRLKRGKLDILVATDVAARGLDVERISHVINYDIPNDPEAFIHRVGRTGRAGRKGEAILFVAPRERRMLGAIERATRQPMEPLDLPSTEAVNNKRVAAFKQRISDTLAAGELAFMQSIVEQYQQEHDVPALEIAAALARLTLGDQQLLLPDADRPGSSARSGDAGDHRRDHRGDRPERRRRLPDRDKERFRLEVGRVHGVRPANIVGAIANEAGLDGQHIGPIEIDEEFSLVDLPVGMPREVFRDLKKVWICGQQLRISRVDEADPVKPAGFRSKASAKPNSKGKRGGKPPSGRRKKA
jgi:ATP-dependent RNA helicase DeaD